MNELDIAEVAHRAGVPASTLRYYEERGLITPVGRRGLRRQFAPDVLERLALIALGRTAGFTLDEIAGMLAPDGKHDLDRTKLTDRAKALDRTIQELTTLRDTLEHAATCPAPTHMECRKFREILNKAMKNPPSRTPPGPNR